MNNGCSASLPRLVTPRCSFSPSPRRRWWRSPGITVPNIRAVLCVQNKVLADRNKVRSGRLVEELLREAGESRCGHE